MRQAIARGERALPRPAGVGVVDETRLEDAFEVRHQQMMHDAVPKVGREDLALLRAVGGEADRAAGAVGVRPQLALQVQKLRLGVDLEGEGVVGGALPAPAGAIAAMEVPKPVQVSRPASSAP